ncbi:hypothetical protein TURU_091632 [Turdus rufiventris]|nr:hypothetical protein TURU_091632 [Turdus rufiventris]
MALCPCCCHLLKAEEAAAFAPLADLLPQDLQQGSSCQLGVCGTCWGRRSAVKVTDASSAASVAMLLGHLGTSLGLIWTSSSFTIPKGVSQMSQIIFPLGLHLDVVVLPLGQLFSTFICPFEKLIVIALIPLGELLVSVAFPV